MRGLVEVVMKWFKCSNTIALNPKLGIVAHQSKTYKHEVLALWVYLLAEASRNGDKGNLGKLDFEAIDYALDFTPNRAQKIYKAFNDKGLIENNSIVGWLEYQADPTAAERQRKSRANKASKSQPVTPSHSDVTESHEVTPEEKRREEKREDNDDDYKQKLFIEISLEIQKILNTPLPANTQRIYAWLDAGADKELITETLKVTLARKKGAPPNTLAYFEQPIADAIAAKNNPLPKGNPNGTQQNFRQNNYPAKQSVTDATREAIAAIYRGEL